MTFQRQNFKGELTPKVLEQELYSLLNSYTPSTMMATELDEFNSTLISISKDYDGLELSFEDTFNKIVDGLKKHNENYVSPIL